MKTLLLLPVLLLGLQSVAMADSRVDAITAKLKSLNGHVGTVVSSYESDVVGRSCRLEVEDYDYEMGNSNSVGTAVFFRDTGSYFTPSVSIDKDTTYYAKNTLLVSTSSKRPGGDACGDFGGAVRYKQTITVEGNQVTMRQQFRCVLDGFEKYDLATTCQF